MSTLRSSVIGAAVAAFLPLATPAQTSWVADRQTQQRLASGEVVIQSAIGAGEPRGRVHAAVRIKARPEAIWRVMTDCEQALSFVPGLRVCHRLDGAPDGTWEVIEHEVKYSWMLPTVRYVFRADYERPHRIDFRRVSGDLRNQEGTWLLEETPDGSATIVEYEVYVDLGFWVPQLLVRHLLGRDLPAGLTGLRTRVESLKATPP